MFKGHLSRQLKRYSQQTYHQKQKGFTLLEIFIVLALIGILLALTMPGWFSFLARWQLTDAQADIYSAIRQTQAKARNNSINWQFSIRETDTGIVQWAIHAQASMPQGWENLNVRSIDIDVANTTLDKRNGAYYIRFNYKGRLASRTRTLTLTNSKAIYIKRCVVMSTLLGAMRKGDEQQKPSSSGRYCY